MGFVGLTSFPFGTNENIGTDLASPGYAQLESGLILQWGFAASVNCDFGVTGLYTIITFPVAFPNKLVNAHCTIQGSATTGPAGNVLAVFPWFPAALESLTVMNIAILGGTNAQTTGVYWLAVGY